MSCIAEPISWLRLERYALGELAATDARAVSEHVAACAVCRGCLDRITADARALPPLRAPALAARRRWSWPRLAWAGALATAAAALLLFVIVRPEPTHAPSAHLRLKGGVELVVTAVRDRAGTITLAPTTFAPGDRFKLRLTCSTPTPVSADIVVFQNDAPAFPLAPTRLTCGNDVVLPGAFTITGSSPALACVAIDRDRTALTPRSPGLACVQLDRER